jgi:hypothetical protein
MNVSKLLLPQFVDSFIERAARDFSHTRKLEVLTGNRDILDSISSPLEAMLEDYLSARALFVLNVVEREIPFGLLDSQSYKHLENSWLRRVKQTKAFYIWKNGGTGNAEADFDKAGKEIRAWFISRKQADLQDFERVKAYIEEGFLGAKRNLDDGKPSAHSAIENKAKRIWQTTGQTNEKLNWFRAKLYVTMYYENIVGAVTETEDQARKTATILKAFEFSKSPENNYQIINAFEAAVAMEYLNKDVIAELLKDPSSFDFNLVPVDDWPEHIEKPTICGGRFSYERDAKQIVYEGEMSEHERDAIRAEVKTEVQRLAIDHLFLQSRRRPLEEMFL